MQAREHEDDESTQVPQSSARVDPWPTVDHNSGHDYDFLGDREGPALGVC